MSISDKTRKTLWARSGNRCAMCRTELVAEKNEFDRNLNIGDECHIISEKDKGPRHIPNYDKNYDDYENLILLCKNHHKTIDELWETYTEELLRTFKKNHENWIKTVIDNAKDKSKSQLPKFFPRLKTGKEIVDIVKDASAYQFSHDELHTKEELHFISGFLQNIQDWSEFFRFSGSEISEMMQFEFDLNKEIEELEKLGFKIFGECRNSRLLNFDKEDLGVWKIATLVVLRKNNSSIIDFEQLATNYQMENK